MILKDVNNLVLGEYIPKVIDAGFFRDVEKVDEDEGTFKRDELEGFDHGFVLLRNTVGWLSWVFGPDVDCVVFAGTVCPVVGGVPRFLSLESVHVGCVLLVLLRFRSILPSSFYNAFVFG